MELLLPYVIPPALLTLAMPRQYFARYLGWLGIAVVLVLLSLFGFPRGRGSGVAEALGFLILVSVGVVTGAAALAKLVYYALRDASRPNRAQGAAQELDASWRILLIAAGSVTALVLLRIFMAVLQGASQAWAAHLTVLAFAGGSLALRRSVRVGFEADRDVMTAGFRSYLAGIAATLTVGALASMAYPMVVKAAAEQAADGQPYCLQVSTGLSRPDYRAARTLLDLSALTMQSRVSSGLYMEHHAILVVGLGVRPELFHWSHRQRQFIRGVISTARPADSPLVACQVQRDFLARLPLALP